MRVRCKEGGIGACEGKREGQEQFRGGVGGLDAS